MMFHYLEITFVIEIYTFDERIDIREVNNHVTN